MFAGADPERVASAVASEARTCHDGGGTFDLSYRWERDELRVLMHFRASSSEEEFASYTAERKELGRFGALELGGWVVCVRDPAVFRKLTADPAELGARYRRALRRISRGWHGTS